MEASTSSIWHPSEIACDQSRDMAIYSPSCAPHQPAVFRPICYEPGYAYPLIVWLHGARHNEAHLNRVMPQLSLRNYIGVAPCRVSGRSSPDANWLDGPENFSDTCDQVFQAIDWVADRTHIHRSRVFLAGSGSGGTTALRIALAFPQRFSGAISLSGSFPSGKNSLADIRNARRLRFFLAARQGSSEYSLARVSKDLQLMKSAGLTVTFRQYSALKQSQQVVYTDMNRWMMQLIAEGRG